LLFLKEKCNASIQFIRNVVTTCAALLAIIAPGVEGTAQTQPAKGVKTVLLIHGAWADGSSWSKIIPLLESKGLHVVAVQIPLTSFSDDVAATQRAMDLETGQYCSSVIPTAGRSSLKRATIQKWQDFSMCRP
jgi:hypothetical protein